MRWQHLVGLLIVLVTVVVGAGLQIIQNRSQLWPLGKLGPSQLWQAMRNDWLVQPESVTLILTSADLTDIDLGQAVIDDGRGELAYMTRQGQVALYDTHTQQLRLLSGLKNKTILGFRAGDAGLLVGENNAITGQTIVSLATLGNKVRLRELVKVKSDSLPSQWWSTEPLRDKVIIPACREGACRLFSYSLHDDSLEKIELQNDQAVELEPSISKLIFSETRNKIFLDDQRERVYWVHDFTGKPYHFIHRYPHPDNQLVWLGLDPLSFTLLFYSPVRQQVYFYDASYVHLDYLASPPPAESTSKLNYVFFPRKTDSGYQLIDRKGKVVTTTAKLPVWWQ